MFHLCMFFYLYIDAFACHCVFFMRVLGRIASPSCDFECQCQAWHNLLHANLHYLHHYDPLHFPRQYAYGLYCLLWVFPRAGCCCRKSAERSVRTIPESAEHALITIPNLSELHFLSKSLGVLQIISTFAAVWGRNPKPWLQWLLSRTYRKDLGNLVWNSSILEAGKAGLSFYALYIAMQTLMAWSILVQSVGVPIPRSAP